MGFVAYTSGGQVAQSYGQQIYYEGHQIYIASAESGQIDGNPAKVVHVGYTKTGTFRVEALYTKQSIIVLNHNIRGYVGQMSYYTVSGDERVYGVGENISYRGISLRYEGQAGNYLVYKVGNTSYYLGVAPYQSTYYVEGDRGYAISVEESGGQTYIRVATFLVKELAINSVVLWVMLATVIYLVGFTILKRKEVI